MNDYMVYLVNGKYSGFDDIVDAMRIVNGEIINGVISKDKLVDHDMNFDYRHFENPTSAIGGIKPGSKPDVIITELSFQGYRGGLNAGMRFYDAIKKDKLTDKDFKWNISKLRSFTKGLREIYDKETD